ncbi:MAG: rod shape-determining protein MreC, partial [Gammaproteobacteria bacterium]|nr:rod shape-determining protein MreC [Gammaproteobacteria bacterium]
ITSGLGGKFPPGYPVATVREIRSVTGQPFLDIVATPVAALNRMREVLLIKPQDDPAPAEPATNDASDSEPAEEAA